MALAEAAEARVGRGLEAVARGLAYLGGAALVGMALVTVASIAGRALIFAGLSPITGDYEIVEMGCAFAVFAFLPLCQLRRGHAVVDVFVQPLPARAQAALGLAGDAVIAAVAGVILWRFWLGFGEKLPLGSEGVRAALGFGRRPVFAETTYELELPLWIPYAAALLGAALFFVVALYTVWRSLNWTIAGREGAVGDETIDAGAEAV